MKTSAPSTKDVCLERLQFAVQRYLNDFAIANAIDVTTFIDQESRHLVLDLRATLAGEKLDSRRVRYPADWWQAFKARWFPRRWLKRWPVHYTIVQMDLWAAYPHVSMPREEHFFTVTKQ